MVKKIVFISIVLIILIPVCAFASGKTEPTKEEPTAADKVKGPQYGGTFRIFQWCAGNDPASPDIAIGNSGIPMQWLSPIQERPMRGDIEKYGPRGTGTWPFDIWAYIPEYAITGNYLESWEVSPERVVWNIRPGIYWAPNEDQSAWMPVRELVAEDVVADLIKYRAAPGGSAFKEYSGDIYAIDKYTCAFDFTKFTTAWWYRLGYEDRAVVSAPEMENAPGGAGKWENQVGTGPFMFKEYVLGSHFSYVRNPDYWGKTTIDGVEYQIPFADELVYPIIPDESTQVAAIRTGSLDFHHGLLPRNWETLQKTARGLLSSLRAGASGQFMVLNTLNPPLDNMDVRRALMIGTDLEALGALAGAGILPKHWFPVYTGDPNVYTPLEDLPPETRLLFDYSPDLAKKMLADAGYPDGFAINIYAGAAAGGTSDALDDASLIAGQWKKFGLEVKIVAQETVIHKTMIRKRDYVGVSIEGGEIGNPLDSLLRRGETEDFFNFPSWSNERYDDLIHQAYASTDSAEQMRLAKEAAIILINEAPYIPFRVVSSGHFWWPWIKNYYGETNSQDMDIAGIIARAWLDQDLKKEMGH